MSERHLFSGSCHCGGIRTELSFTRPAAETQVRACQCGFCRRQGAATVSDPLGHARIEIVAGQLTTYRFGTATATSLICSKCGVYAGAVLQDGDRLWSIANTRGLAITAFDGRAGVPMQYEHETAAERVERRKQRWTPTDLRITVAGPCQRPTEPSNT